jgi:hypothetical protein
MQAGDEQVHVVARVADEGDALAVAGQIVTVVAGEDDLGVALLERNSRRVGLTPAGAAFLPEAERLVARLHPVRLRPLHRAEV